MGTSLRLESLASGRTLASRYRLDRVLQAGTLAVVWQARDVLRELPIVLKLVANEPAALAALEQERKLAAAVDHPRVPKPDGPFTDGEFAFLVSDPVAGNELSQWRGKPWREVAPYIVELIDLLETVHARGIVHRDLKPANVVIDREGLAYLLDFGAATVLGGGQGGGSPYSRSPEQAQGAPATVADDLHGLGAVFYELLVGYPPRYLQTRPTDTLPAVHAVPPSIADQVLQLLATDPARRPSLAAVRELIDRELRNAGTDSTASPRAPIVNLVPPPRAPEPAWKPAALSTGDGGGHSGVNAPATRSPPWLALTVGALVIGLLGVLFVLPRWVASQPPDTPRRAPNPALATTPVTAAAPQSAAPLPTTPEALQALAEQKTRAEEARDRYEAALTPLRSQPVTSWGGDPWRETESAGTIASQKYAAREYAAAADEWQRGVSLAARVAAARGPALQKALQAGRQALLKPDAQAAVMAFTQALAIQPGQAEATAGLKRAQTLDQVLALLDEGADFERSRRWQQAGDRYRRALTLDAVTPAAHAGLARVAQQVSGDAFAAAMATGFRAAAANDRAGARAAFARADSLRPGSSEVRDALAALDGAERTDRLARLRTDAQAAERAERWSDAQQAYDAALALDATVVFAQEGRTRVAPRADVAGRLEALLARPERLTFATVREEARALLSQATRWSEGPVFKQQRERIEALLRGAETPVRVALESDNVTDVVVYRVGRLGTFERQELELLPGRYTIVGKRAGFRDVRREVEIPPGATPPPVTVRCEERI